MYNELGIILSKLFLKLIVHVKEQFWRVFIKNLLQSGL